MSAQVHDKCSGQSPSPRLEESKVLASPSHRKAPECLATSKRLEQQADSIRKYSEFCPKWPQYSENGFSQNVDSSEIEFWRVEILEPVSVVATTILAAELHENHEGKMQKASRY